MATITGLTAERMSEMDNNQIVDADIVGGELILTTKGGSQINAGSVTGPIGPIGPAGPGPIIGEMRMTILTAVSTGWFLMNGQRIVDAATLYPTLFAAVPAGWKTGADIILPDTSRRHIIGSSGNAPGEIGGNDMISLAVAHLPAHAHAKGSLATSAAGSHSHQPSNGSYSFAIHMSNHADTPSGLGQASTVYGLTFTGTTSVAPNHAHTVTGNTANAGSGTPYEHRPKYMTVNMMIFAGP
jgi:microcystin-dependent protein